MIQRRRSHNPKSLYRFHGVACAYCTTPMSLPWCGSYIVDINKDRAPSRDHVIPLARGGPDIDDNILVVCRRCNLLKGDLTLREYYEHLVADGEPEAAHIAMMLERFDRFLPDP